MIEITAEYLASQGLSKTFPRRFWAKVRKTETCWIWTGCLTTAFRYGWIGCGGRGMPSIKAHRASWILHNGPIPDGMFILHHCDCPQCVSPFHLWAGSQEENIRDSVQKGRMAIGAINNGAKLTEQQVLEIRRLYSEGGITQQSLGLQFGVARECITAIVNRKNWTHI